MTSLSDKTILIVEDESSIAFIMKEMLSDLGANILLAENGAEAMRLVRKSYCDLLVVDLTLPDTNGMELYFQIVQEKPHLATRFIFMTGYDLQAELDRLVKKTGNRFIQKPFQLLEFRELVSQAIKELG